MYHINDFERMVNLKEITVISPMILPFNTKLAIQIRFEKKSSVALQEKACWCRKIAQGW